MSTIRWITEDGASDEIPIRSYPGGEPLIHWSHRPRVRAILLRPTSMLDLMGGLFFADALAERGNGPLRLVLPFVPGARQDRLNDGGDYLFTAKSVAKEINARGFSSVTVVDPHSEVIAGLIDRCRVVHAHDCLHDGLPKYQPAWSTVISPDAGAEKRAGGVAKLLGLPLSHAWKQRNIETGAIAGFGLETAARSGRALVVDDICDGGATFLGLVDVIEKFPFEGSDLYVTHGIFSKGTDALLKRFGRIYCTDSIQAERPGVTVIPICNDLLMKAKDE